MALTELGRPVPYAAAKEGFSGRAICMYMHNNERTRTLLVICNKLGTSGPSITLLAALMSLLPFWCI